MKGLVKTILRAVLPASLFQRLSAVRSRRYQVQLLRREGIVEATGKYIEQNGLVVRYGPFAGMVYPREAALFRASIPKLLGTYEQELHPLLLQIRSRDYDLVLDIGSAEGYYAVGLARLLGKQVLAFDPEPVERKLCLEAARLNGVESLVTLADVFGAADVKTYAQLRVLCVCDCEGFEAQIFTPETVKQARRWDVLIELHDATQTSIPALPWPHRLTTFETGSRTQHYTELDGIGQEQELLSERRSYPQQWLWCESKSSQDVPVSVL